MQVQTYADFEARVSRAIRALQAEQVLPETLDLSSVHVEEPKKSSYGDLTTNVALILAVNTQHSPQQLATLFVEKLTDSLAYTVTATPTGFINFTLTDSYMQGVLQQLLQSGQGATVKTGAKSDDSRIFSLQYAYTRMCLIGRQQHDMGMAAQDPKKADFSQLQTAEDKALIKHLALFNGTAAHTDKLAALFHNWYTRQQILQPKDLPLTYARLALLSAAKVVLSLALELLGVNAPETM